MDAWRHVQRTDTNRSKSYPRTARYAAVAAVSVFGCQGPTGQSGGNSEEDPPVPMPNTEVKLFSVDDSRGFSPRESRSLPGFFIIFRSSSVVEQSAVNRLVAGSNPACGATGELSEWPKEHDWKSCRRHSRLEGSNPSLSAIHIYFKGPLVKWLRHRPFTAVTRVRIPYGSPTWRISSAGRAPALQAGGRQFDPVILHHFLYTIEGLWCSG